MLFLRQLMTTLGIVHLLMSMIDVSNCFDTDLLKLACDEKDEYACYQFFHTRMASWCSNGLCYCRDPENNHSVTCKPMEFLMSDAIGGICPCSQPNAFCDPEENVCYCKDNYVPTEDRKSCIPVSVPLGEPCELDSQCRHFGQPFVECHHYDKNCTCKRGYVVHEGRCLARLDTICDRDRDCEVCGISVCTSDHYRPKRMKCACGHNYARMQKVSKCILASDYNEHCTHDSMCQVFLGEGGFCNGSNKCACNESYYLGNKTEGFEVPPEIRDNWDYHLRYRCLPEPVYGSYCRNHSDCERQGQTKKQQIMECIYGECTCKYGYKSIDNIHCEFDESLQHDDKSTGTTIAGKMLIFQAFLVSLSFLVINFKYLISKY